jgi:hypothetical protein
LGGRGLLVRRLGCGNFNVRAGCFRKLLGGDDGRILGRLLCKKIRRPPEKGHAGKERDNDKTST